MRWKMRKGRCVLRPGYRQQIRAKATNRDILVNYELGGSQRDGLSFERGIEINHVAVVRIDQRLS